MAALQGLNGLWALQGLNGLMAYKLDGGFKSENDSLIQV